MASQGTQGTIKSTHSVAQALLGLPPSCFLRKKYKLQHNWSLVDDSQRNQIHSVIPDAKLLLDYVMQPTSFQITDKCASRIWDYAFRTPEGLLRW